MEKQCKVCGTGDKLGQVSVRVEGGIYSVRIVTLCSDCAYAAKQERRKRGAN